MRALPKKYEGDEAGFTLIEMTVALIIIGGVLVALAALMTGSLSALGASRQRSSMTEILNGEIERHRATTYDEVGVLATDPDIGTQYQVVGGVYVHDGREAVIATGAAVLPAKTVITTSPVAGVPVPYTIERWVTWTDTSGGSTHEFKRIDLRVTWKENQRVDRHISFTTVVYPGGRGPSTFSNNVPEASFTVSNANPAIGDTVTFTATATDADGDLLSYSWSFGDSSTSTAGSTVTHTYTAANIYSVSLTVTDPAGGTAAPPPQTITVPNPANSAPVITSVSVTGVVPRDDQVNASVTATDVDGDPLTYTWDWGDSSTSTGNNVGHTYTSIGTRTITLTVSDPSHSVSQTQSWTVTALQCSVQSLVFANPTGSTTTNYIKLKSNGRADKTSITATATVIAAAPCNSTSLQLRIPLASTTFTLTLSRVGSTDTWAGSGDLGNHQFNTGNNQTGEVWTPANTGTTQKFSFSFSASQ